MQNTTNYNLNKPDGNDFAKIQALNENADIIDTKLKELETTTEVVETRQSFWELGYSAYARFPEKCQTITDWNAITNNGMYMGLNAANAPTTGWYFGTVIAHSNDYVVQKVIAFSNENENVTEFERSKAASTWGAWIETSPRKLFQSVSNGKQLIGTAITDVDNSLVVPTNPTFQQLADLIRAIETGYKHAIGTSQTSFTGDINSSTYTQLVIDGLDFVPKLVIATHQGNVGSEIYGKGIVYSTGEIFPAYNYIAFGTTGITGGITLNVAQNIGNGIRIVASDRALRDSTSGDAPQVNYDWIALG